MGESTLLSYASDTIPANSETLGDFEIAVPSAGIVNIAVESFRARCERRSFVEEIPRAHPDSRVLEETGIKSIADARVVRCPAFQPPLDRLAIDHDIARAVGRVHGGNVVHEEIDRPR